MKRSTHWLLGWLLLLSPMVAAQTWVLHQPMPSPRYGITAVHWNNQIVVMGGRDAGDSLLALVESFDYLSGVWSRFPADLRAPRCNAAAVVYHGRIHIVGGAGDSSQALATAEFYDEQTGQWQQLPALSVAREGAAVAVINDTLFAIGGYDGTSPLKSIEYYHSAFNQWQTSRWQLSTPRGWLAATTLNDSIFTVGGLLLAPVGILERYHSSDGSRRRADMPTPRGRMAAVNFQNELWTLGGAAQHGATETVELYEYYTNQWRSGIPLIQARELHAAVVAREKIYVLGGRDAEGNVLASVEVFQPLTAVAATERQLPQSPVLRSYPNPFAQTVRIVLQTAGQKAGMASVVMHDLLGATVFRRQITGSAAGIEVLWDGKDQTGQQVQDGLYFITIRAGDTVFRHKLLKLGR
ncbi:MAG: T9SS type A sorting domain-containing protein [candidate division KSB1 bacterium]|nr:T9SS type A sorting domain-containing protein [candidate division KSB1 bacterium]MDZ7285648.1 T9SS type A sorting domain-containing protein [candidate division KSB1 bacterium]MDZ7298680.1 T9SS type A sorting domain-containing protein [candidate division KSB1 bacterium]MDZ7308412.1 T9SS type A sorting domain-containing protein [candidate division KSB1 bacterium]MDZ7349545.1 T9SS type A sorting domain-containing protein [candidate division KSB1 bacterium]